MSGRCIACNNKLTEQELINKVKSNITHKTTYQDLCGHCTKEADLNHFAIIEGRTTPYLEIEDE